MEAVGGHAGGVYLRSGTDGLLRMAVVTGLPGRLFRPWWADAGEPAVPGRRGVPHRAGGAPAGRGGGDAAVPPADGRAALPLRVVLRAGRRRAGAVRGAAGAAAGDAGGGARGR
ncbi:predicted protein [Streptomyces sp. C]|nr:predicted protein [Streptomyces sp. C]